VAHEAAAIRADGERLVSVFVSLGLAGGGVGLAGRLTLKQVAHAREGLASVALGEEAVVTDAVEAVGQDVQQETPDELVRGEAHDGGTPAATIVLVGERDVVVADGHEPRIGDGGSVGVASEIGEHAFGSAEWRFGVDDKGALAQRAHALGEGGGVGERGEFAEEAEFAAMEGGRQSVQEKPAERPRQRVDGQEEVRLAGDPALAVDGDAAAGDERQ